MSRDDRPPAIEKGPCGCAPFSGLGGEGKRRRVAGDQKKKRKKKTKERNEGDEKNCTRLVFSLGRDLD